MSLQGWIKLSVIDVNHGHGSNLWHLGQGARWHISFEGYEPRGLDAGYTIEITTNSHYDY